MRRIGRRPFLILLAASVVGARALTSPAAAARPPVAERSARSARALVRGVVRDGVAAGRVGRSYLSAVPDEADARTLLEALAPAGIRTDEWWLHADAAAFAREMRRRTRADFRAGNTVELDGWFLSRVESRLAALWVVLGS